jgi:hypothetical protein
VGGKTKVGGIDLNKLRVGSVLEGVIALSSSPDGFSASQLVNGITAEFHDPDYVQINPGDVVTA